MSDFIYTSVSQAEGVLSNTIRAIYRPAADAPATREYHGAWGSLAVSHNQCRAFEPLETDRYILVVIGAPVLCFTHNRFLTGRDATAGTRAIDERWQKGAIRWDDDLSGPFVVLKIDKNQRRITCVTDLMMFIPVYRYASKACVMLATHVDALAKAAGRHASIDPVSLADFVLNNVVTHPYTVYRDIYQSTGATLQVFKGCGDKFSETESKAYWRPKVSDAIPDFCEAAAIVREGLRDYVGRITESMDTVAHFISGGEDSRVIAGCIPRPIKRDAFVLLDGMNREGRIAKRVADAYGAGFHAGYRGPDHYLDVLPEASELTGRGYGYYHAHSVKFHETCRLNRYDAVFGGFLSDVFLKGIYTRLRRMNEKYPFLPQMHDENKLPAAGGPDVINLDAEISGEITRRRQAHLEKLIEMRPGSAVEWFYMWPAGMVKAMPFFWASRRLFRAYEPFMCKQVVKISALAPTPWKLNRRLFHAAVRPFLKSSRWIAHADGRLPYFPWPVNLPVHTVRWVLRKTAVKFGLSNAYHGPWTDWDRLMSSHRWHETVAAYRRACGGAVPGIDTDACDEIFEGDSARFMQKLNLLQVFYSLGNNR